MSFSFLGTAAGSAYGLLLWKFGGWQAVTIGCAVLALLSLLVYGLTYKSNPKKQKAQIDIKLIRKFAFKIKNNNNGKRNIR